MLQNEQSYAHPRDDSIARHLYETRGEAREIGSEDSASSPASLGSIALRTSRPAGSIQERFGTSPIETSARASHSRARATSPSPRTTN